jgi:predicted tellurium resistance membrane protein TerC
MSNDRYFDRLRNLIDIVESNFSLKKYRKRVIIRGILLGVVPSVTLVVLIIWLFFLAFEVATVYLPTAQPRDITIIVLSIATLTVGLFTFVNKLFSDMGAYFKESSKDEITNWHFKGMKKCVRQEDIPLLMALIVMKSKRPDLNLKEIFSRHDSMFAEKRLLERLYENN